MGNKQALSGRVAALTTELEQPGPLIDLFAGMGWVAGATASTGRQAWTNDLQNYAHLAARCLLRSQDPPPSRATLARLLAKSYRENLAALRDRFEADLVTERRVVARATRESYERAATAWRHAANDDGVAAEVRELASHPATFPYRLATLTFAWGYFGLRQAMEIDSVRYAIDAAAEAHQLSDDEVAWARLALLQTASRCSAGPGHFAQFLRGTTNASVRRIAAQRRRSVWHGVLDDVERLRPFGTPEWRAENETFLGDTLEIWPELDDRLDEPAVFYADPPYSKEHYSRFYHVLETLDRYDYPDAVGVGRYRPDRIATPFSTKSQVVAAVTDLAAAIAERGGAFLLSYPSTGLLTQQLGVDVRALLSEHFKRVDLAIEEPARHSTLGARHGRAATPVVEYVWLAQ